MHYRHEKMIWADIETYSDLDLKKVGTYNYATHPSTEVIMFQFAIDDGPVTVWEIGEGPPLAFFKALKDGYRLGFWNTQFDYLVLTHQCPWPELFDFSQVSRDSIHDIMAWAQACNVPAKLEKACKFLGLPPEFHKSAGGHLINKFCKPRALTANNNKTRVHRHDAPQAWSDFVYYGVQDIVAMRQAATYLPEISKEAHLQWWLTYDMNLRGLPVCRHECEILSNLATKEKEKLNHESVFFSGGAFNSITAKAKVKEWLVSHGVQIKTTNPKGELIDTLSKKAVQVYLEENPDIDQKIKKVLEASLQVSQTSSKKFDSFLQLLCQDGTIKFGYRWHGAATGRFSSSGGLNLQNMKRPIFKNSEEAKQAIAMLTTMTHEESRHKFSNYMDVLTSCARYVIKAPEGFDFIDADYSSIENRVAAWLANDQALLEQFERGVDQYRIFATKLSDVSYEGVSDEQRTIAKACVLGLQFGQGSRGLVEFVKDYGVDLAVKDARRILRIFRKTHLDIRNMWYNLEDCALEAVANPDKEVRCTPRISIFCTCGFLCVRLPSGRIIRWCAPRIEMKETPLTFTEKGEGIAGDNYVEDFIKAGWTVDQLIDADLVYRPRLRRSLTVLHHEKGGAAIYRGSLTGSTGLFQSVTQAVAYDVIISGKKNLLKKGYNIVMTTHDELLSLQKKGEGSEEDFIEHMCTVDEWASGLPVKATSWRDDRYQK